MPSLSASLPLPDPDALAHSAKLTQHLLDRIHAQGGWLSFADFMEALLYAPGLGYYAAGATKFCEEGDFVTAPEISPLFGRTLARFAAPVLTSIQGARILEPGAGTGRLAASILETLDQLGALPDRYLILEPSPSLQAIQHKNLSKWLPSLVERVEWIQDLPKNFRGVILANEVLDAIPVHLMVTTDRLDAFLERGVGVDETDGTSTFTWVDRPANPNLNQLALKHLSGEAEMERAPGTLFELGLPAEAWSRGLAESLEEGLMVLIDYGFPAREMYHPQRRNGTLMCHYRHHAHDDPFLYPGLQDVTAHVDFTAIASILKDKGLDLDRYQTQAGFLLENGILETLTPGLEPGSVAWLKETTGLQKLLSPAEMGELFKVLVASKHLSEPHKPEKQERSEKFDQAQNPQKAPQSQSSHHSPARHLAVCQQLGL